MFPSTFCSKRVHGADNILISWEFPAWYSALPHVSNTLMIITLLKNHRTGLHKYSKNREPPQNYRSQKGNMKQDTWGGPTNFRSPVQDLVAMATLYTSATRFTREHSTSTALHCCVLQVIGTVHTRQFSYCVSVSGQSVVARKRHGKSADIIITCLII